MRGGFCAIISRCISIRARSRTHVLLDVVGNVQYEARELSSGDAITTHDNITMDVGVHELVIEEEKKDLLYQLAAQECEDGRGGRLIVFFGVEVLYLVRELIVRELH